MNPIMLCALPGMKRIKATGTLNMNMPGERASRLAILGMIITPVIFVSVILIPYLVIPPEEIPKPTLGEGDPVETKHIDYLVRRLGVGNLQAVAGLGRTPEMEFLVKPANRYFTVTIENGVPRTMLGRADDPDIRLSGDRDVIASLLSAGDLFSEVKKLNQEGKITMEMLREREDLISIGYESLYNDLTK